MMMINPTLTLQKKSRWTFVHFPIPRLPPEQLNISLLPASSVSFRQQTTKNVQNSIAARVALPPAQCACRKALPHHRATTQDFEELEELGGAMDAGRRFDLLLQHFERVC
jgi:hypothetical protein